MALAAKVPVVPVAMKNSQVTRKAGLPWIDHPVVVIGKPLDFSEFYGRGDDPRVLRWVTDQVMAAIHDLSGQTYIEAYGTSVKSGSLTSTEADARILERPGINTRPPSGAAGRRLGRVRRAGRACRDLSVAAERWRCSPSTRALRFEAPVPTAYCDPGVDADSNP